MNMLRLRLQDLRASSLPSDLGICQSDIPALAGYVNSAQRRLIFCKEASEDGWSGGFAEVLFYVSRDTPYITLPREIARLEAVNVCSRPISVAGPFFEYLCFGNGRMPKCHTACGPSLTVFSRNSAPTFVDLTNPPQLITVFASDPSDYGRRVLVQGLDQNNIPVRSADGTNQVSGIFLPLQFPFVATPLPFNTITGIQKDVTVGQVKFYQTHPTTGDQVLLLTMEAGETTAWYRRYLLYPLPHNCCPNPDTTNGLVPVTAIAKLDLLPVKTDTDYLLLQNQAAIEEECLSVKYSRMDTPSGKQFAEYHHKQAVRHLNAEITHLYGQNYPAVRFSPFGTARLERLRIGSMQ